jgi:CHAT domain-containing protein
MPDRLCLSFCRYGLFYILIIIIFVTFSCRTTPGLSVEDAKKMIAFGEHGLTPPPRAGVDANMARPKYLAGFDAVCRSEPPKSIDIARIIQNIKVYCRGRTYCLADKLFYRGREAMYSGEYTDAIALIKAAIRKAKDNQDDRYRPYLGTSYAAIGDFKAARRFIGGGRSNLFQSKSANYQVRINNLVGRATLERLKGNYRGAEWYYRKAQKLCQRGLKDLGHYVFYDTETQFMPDLGEVILMQGRLVEAQLVLRASFYRHAPRWSGRNIKMRSLAMLGRVYYQQGRYADAELITRAAIGGYRLYGECSLLDMNIAYQDLARIFLAQDRPKEALQQFETVRHNMRHTPRIFKMRFANDPDWAYGLLTVGAFSRAETMLANALKTALKQYGDDHHRTAEIRGLLAVAQYRQSKTKEAERNFAAALPVLLEYNRVSSAQANTRIAFSRRLEHIAEAYLAFVFQQQGIGEIAAKTTFPLADVLRGQSVQRAVRASSTRIAARDPRLADLVRREQDADKRITALNAVLLNARTQTDGGGKKTDALTQQIEQLVQARVVILDEIESAFPAYAELTRPRPKTLDAVKAALQPDEALLAFYLGSKKAFVWSVTGKGASEFTVIPINTQTINSNVQAVRRSLKPRGPRLGDLPEFDIKAANRLYQALLKPVRSSWENTKHLIIVPHGSLGHLPFGLLHTTRKVPKSHGKLPFYKYRKVSWLIRDHSITVLPSSGTLITLRSLPQTDSTRKAYAGFGDPLFNKKQSHTAPENILADKSSDLPTITTRAIRVTKMASLDESYLTSATLEMLQPLPDTRQEVLAIADALKADVDNDVYLGKAASETALKQLDLSNRRVLVFATHGLVSGDLDGLRQPALALSSPKVTGETKNDGLLTMGEIMGLRFNADWVVLSACNTAAGQGAGSEAISGLGQAFFYAGTRAILASNWPVESTSARILTTELFRQQEAYRTLPRAVALQKSILKLLDERVYRDPKGGKMIYAYAHPIFWGPFSLIGEGGTL